jgi:glutamate/tyrosine decarboxylase-like PLP-dependent enzyme
MNEREFRALLERGMDGVEAWEASWPSFTPDPSVAIPFDQAAAAIDALAERLRDNYPFFHPDYAGQMLKPPHPVALAAYAMTARINPNNHALDGGPATAALEREVIAQIATMFGYGSDHLGHLTSSGTIANLEALWVSSKLRPGMAIAFSEHAHYTHARMCALLGVPSIAVPVDARGRMDVTALAGIPESANIGTVVVTPGATASGAVDPVHEIVALAAQRGWRVHADAAYGGFFKIIAEQPEARIDPAPWKALASCDSIVVDPHKHGLQPYGCGCVLFRDAGVGRLYKHDSPYTYFTSQELHLGEISLECSRAGASAAALWATLRCLPLSPAGLGRVLLATRTAALIASAAARTSGALQPVVEPELDIVSLAPVAAGSRATASATSARTQSVFDALGRDKNEPIYLAVWRVSDAFGRLAMPYVDWDRDECAVLRSALMKPEHRDRAATIIGRIAAALA